MVIYIIVSISPLAFLLSAKEAKCPKGGKKNERIQRYVYHSS